MGGRPVIRLISARRYLAADPARSSSRYDRRSGPRTLRSCDVEIVRASPWQPWAATVTRVLVGRGPELKELYGVTERARSGVGATLVIRREPSVGKTVLLDELESLAHDSCVIRTDGIESELQLDYAGLHRIVLPFIERLPQLPVLQREAIRAAFGLSATGRPDRFRVGLATLTLLGDPGRSHRQSAHGS